MFQFNLFKDFCPKKILVKFKWFSDISDFNSGFKSKILEIKDVSNLNRIIILNFDLEGRIINIKMGSKQFEEEIKIFERSFDGRFYIYFDNCKNLFLNDTRIYRYYDYYNEKIGEDIQISKKLIDSVNLFLENIVNKKDIRIEQIKLIIEKAINIYNWKGLLKERDTIQKIYCNSISVLPPEVRPDQNPIFSLIQITQGCWIKDQRGPCKFCDAYEGINYREKSISEIKKHIEKVKNNSKENWPYIKKIFLLDGDPLNTRLKTEKYFSFLAEKIPNVKCYESFISTIAILSKPEEEWKRIIKFGLKKVYWGVESADDKMLTLLGKPQTKKSLYKAAKLLNKIGLDYVVILLSGISKFNNDNNHIEESVKFIQDINVRNVYISRFTPQPNTEIYNLIKKRRLLFPNQEERENEHRLMIKMMFTKKNIPGRIIRGTYGVQFNR